MMKYLIVNADDFGASMGINRGILEAHQRGIVTSASLMVNMPAAKEAALLSRDVPDLSVGLHVNFTNEGEDPVVDLTDSNACRIDLQRQFEQFRTKTSTGDRIFFPIFWTWHPNTVCPCESTLLCAISKSFMGSGTKEKPISNGSARKTCSACSRRSFRMVSPNSAVTPAISILVFSRSITLNERLSYKLCAIQRFGANWRSGKSK